MICVILSSFQPNHLFFFSFWVFISVSIVSHYKYASFKAAGLVIPIRSFFIHNIRLSEAFFSTRPNRSTGISFKYVYWHIFSEKYPFLYISPIVTHCASTSEYSCFGIISFFIRFPLNWQTPMILLRLLLHELLSGSFNSGFKMPQKRQHK